MAGYNGLILAGVLFALPTGTFALIGNMHPYVIWNMDNFTRSTLYPEFKVSKNWRGDLPLLNDSSSNVDLFRKGVEGFALHIASLNLSLARDLSPNECVVNVSNCVSGLTISFWIKVLDLGHNPVHKKFILSACEECSLFLALSNTTFIHRLGQSVYATDDASLQGRKWTHVAITWNSTESNVYFNGSKATERFSTTRVKTTIFRNGLDLGSYRGANFYLDDLRVYYSTLSASQIYDISHSKATTNSSTTDIEDKKKNQEFIVIITVVPICLVIACLSFTCWMIRKRRERKSFRSYFRQSSTNLAAHDDQGAFSDAPDDHTDLDSDGELERLHHSLMRDDNLA